MKTPIWDIKTQSWKNVDKGYIDAQEDIVEDLKEITPENVVFVIAEARLENRDFDVYDGDTLLLKYSEYV